MVENLLKVIYVVEGFNSYLLMAISRAPENVEHIWTVISKDWRTL